MTLRKETEHKEHRLDNKILSQVQEFTEEDITDIAFSFDVTALAFLWEEKIHREEGAFTCIRRVCEAKGVSFKEAISAFAKDFFSKPKNYAYLGIFALIVVLIAYIKPLSIEAKERLIAMLPPDMELPKPPPPPPPPPPEPPPPPPPPEEKPPEPKPEPIPEEKLEEIKVEEKKELEQLKEDLKLERRQEEQYQGLKVPAIRSDDATPDLPAAFGNVKRRAGDEFPSSLSEIGTRRKGEVVPGYGKPLDVGAGRAKRKDVGETTLGAPLAEVKKPQVEEKSEDYRGRWVRIENLGPLAHLNQLCYGKSYGQIIYVDIYKLKCGDNQIIEAWRKE